MEEKTKKIDKENEIYDKIEENRKKYQELMSQDAVKNAVKFNQKLNERIDKLGIKACKYVPKENRDGEN
ncbi:MAG: hypothetical protein IJ371_01070 [Clostridia bacterium]|nr:hypothetical protein [Clostridia bacterium]